MNDRHKSLRVFFVLIFFGVLNLLAVLSNPASGNTRWVYVVRLIGTGMCFGAAIVSFVTYFRGSNHSEYKWFRAIMYSAKQYFSFSTVIKLSITL